MSMVSSSFALHYHFGDVNRNFANLCKQISKAKVTDDGTKDFTPVFHLYWKRANPKQ